MGKLLVSDNDLQQLQKAFAADKPVNISKKEGIEIMVGTVKLLICDMHTHFKLEHQGVSFDCRARHRDQQLELDFE